MRTTLFFIFVLLFLSCQAGAAIRNFEAAISFVNFAPDEKKKVSEAVALIKEVIGSEEFRDRILNHTVNGRKTFIDNQGLTNDEIFRKIADGAEIIGDTSRNGTMNVELELFYSPTKTIGYTYPDTNRIWINRKYFRNYTLMKVADNLMHEWMHKLGFDHEKTHSATREYSVPYAVGYLVEELAAKRLRQR